MSGITGATAVAVGGRRNRMVVKSDGSAVGANGYGQLGENSTNQRTTVRALAEMPASSWRSEVVVGASYITAIARRAPNRLTDAKPD
jgi:hypothetical protein